MTNTTVVRSALWFNTGQSLGKMMNAAAQEGTVHAYSSYTSSRKSVDNSTEAEHTCLTELLEQG